MIGLLQSAFRTHASSFGDRLCAKTWEYVRHGTCNVFVAVCPQAGRRTVAVTEHRGKTEFVAFARYLIERASRPARGDSAAACLARRIADPQVLTKEFAAWQRHRNVHRQTLQWTFTRQAEDRKKGHHHVA